MKKMVYLLFTLSFALFLLTACPDKAYDSSTLQIINNSDFDITVYAGLGGGGTLYPDTTLPIKNWTRSVIKKGGHKVEEFNLYDIDTFCLFVLNQDTVDAYPWDSIRSKYMILKRYDLDRRKIKDMNYKLSYSE